MSLSPSRVHTDAWHPWPSRSVSQGVHIKVPQALGTRAGLYQDRAPPELAVAQGEDCGDPGATSLVGEQCPCPHTHGIAGTPCSSPAPG